VKKLNVKLRDDGAPRQTCDLVVAGKDPRRKLPVRNIWEYEHGRNPEPFCADSERAQCGQGPVAGHPGPIHAAGTRPGTGTRADENRSVWVEPGAFVCRFEEKLGEKHESPCKVERRNLQPSQRNKQLVVGIKHGGGKVENVGFVTPGRYPFRHHLGYVGQRC